MGIHEDMTWLATNKKGWGRIFKLIAEEENTNVRKLKDLYGGADWWPVKAYVRILMSRGLVKEEGGVLTLTEQGKKVFEMVKTVEGVPTV
jgi:predicted transcriptional regulator